MNLQAYARQNCKAENSWSSKTPAIVEKKPQKPWSIEDVFDILVPFIVIASADPVVIFVGYNVLIADQNLSGEEALSCNRSL